MKRNLSQIVTLSPTRNRRAAAVGGLGPRGSPSTKTSPPLPRDKKNLRSHSDRAKGTAVPAPPNHPAHNVASDKGGTDQGYF